MTERTKSRIAQVFGAFATLRLKKNMSDMVGISHAELSTLLPSAPDEAEDPPHSGALYSYSGKAIRLADQITALYSHAEQMPEHAQNITQTLHNLSQDLDLSYNKDGSYQTHLLAKRTTIEALVAQRESVIVCIVETQRHGPVNTYKIKSLASFYAGLTEIAREANIAPFDTANFDDKYEKDLRLRVEYTRNMTDIVLHHPLCEPHCG